jgi:hypothetical protein
MRAASATCRECKQTAACASGISNVIWACATLSSCRELLGVRCIRTLWQPDWLGVLFYSAGRVQHLLVVASSRNRNEYLLVVLHSAGCVERAQNDRRTVLCDA